jgi:capsid protein
MPLVMVTGDFSGATFMNMRIAYQKAQDNWKGEQYESLVPLGRRTWKWHIDRNIADGNLDISWLPNPNQKYRVDPIPRVWPYVDPEKEANANKIQLENRTTTRKEICAGEGRESDEVSAQLDKENAAIPPIVPPAPAKTENGPPEKDEKDDKKDNDTK